MYDKIAQEPNGGEQFFNCFLLQRESVVRKVIMEVAFESGASSSFIARLWVPKNFWVSEFERLYIGQ